MYDFDNAVKIIYNHIFDNKDKTIMNAKYLVRSFDFNKSIGEYNVETYARFLNVDSAMACLSRVAHRYIKEQIEDVNTVVAYKTSDERYPDAWGYGNNGYCVKSNGVTKQFEVIEM